PGRVDQVGVVLYRGSQAPRGQLTLIRSGCPVVVVLRSIRYPVELVKRMSKGPVLAWTRVSTHSTRSPSSVANAGRPSACSNRISVSAKVIPRTCRSQNPYAGRVPNSLGR